MNLSIFTGSPRQNGNTAALCRPFATELEALGAKVSQQALSGKNISPCKACYACQQVDAIAGTVAEYGCPLQDDMQALVAEILSCDVLVLATPIYSWFCPAEMKAMLDRHYGLNKFYGSGTGSLWAGKGVALITTHGYNREYGAGPFETGIQRLCKHSHLHYLGMYSVRDRGDAASFQTAEAAEGARAFARDIFARGEEIRQGKS